MAIHPITYVAIVLIFAINFYLFRNYMSFFLPRSLRARLSSRFPSQFAANPPNRPPNASFAAVSPYYPNHAQPGFTGVNLAVRAQDDAQRRLEEGRGEEVDPLPLYTPRPGDGVHPVEPPPTYESMFHKGPSTEEERQVVTPERRAPNIRMARQGVYGWDNM